MSEITRAVIQMPFKMAMESELSRRQFHSIAQELLSECEQLKAENESLRLDADRFRFVVDCPIRTMVALSRMAHEPEFNLSEQCDLIIGRGIGGHG